MQRLWGFAAYREGVIIRILRAIRSLRSLKSGRPRPDNLTNRQCGGAGSLPGCVGVRFGKSALDDRY